jgi:hypothetical protein
VFVEALERDFARWDYVRALIAPADSNAAVERRGEGRA